MSYSFNITILDKSYSLLCRAGWWYWLPSLILSCFTSWASWCSSLCCAVLFLLFSTVTGPGPRPFDLFSTILLVTMLLLALGLKPLPRVLLAAKLTDSWAFLLLFSLGDNLVLANFSASPPEPVFPFVLWFWLACLPSFFQDVLVDSSDALFSLL